MFDAKHPRRPSPNYNWQRGPDYEGEDGSAEVYRRNRLVVLSSFMLAEFRGESRPHWHVSVSMNGQRANNEQVAIALRHFDMQAAEEDKHHSGNARHFFLLADLKPGEVAECECKETEEVVVEPDGYTYSRERAT